jgi:hypothetical protein
MSQRIVIGIIVSVILATTCSGVNISGDCTLQNQTNHAGSRVLFQAISPGAVTDSTFTDGAGYFQINVAAGIYTVNYDHMNYTHEDTLISLFSPLTLPEVTLLYLPPGIHISGSLSGVLVDTVYYVDEDINVDEDSTLIIRPGAKIYFMSEETDPIYMFIVGTLIAEGSDDDSIIFAAGPGASHWSGLSFLSDSDSSRISYCQVIDLDYNAFSCDGSDLLISHCTINLEDNLFGSGIYLSHGLPTIEHCSITCLQGYRGIECGNSDATISHCLITGGFGSGILVYYSNPRISNCTIYGMVNIGIQYGGMNSSDTLTVTNTIVNNSGIWGLFVTNPQSHLSFTYNDFHFNGTGGNFNLPLNYLGQIVTVNSNGDSCDAYYNIFQDPQFVNAAAGDFHLQTVSPCIDAGDPDSPLDPDGTVADIGRYYYDQSAGVYSPPAPPSLISCRLYPSYPNPFNAATVIRYEMRTSSYVSLKVYNTAGRFVTSLVEGWRNAGLHETQFDGSAIAAGVYFLKLQVADEVSSEKIVLLK